MLPEDSCLPSEEVLRALAQLPLFVIVVARAGALLWSSALAYGYGAEAIGRPAEDFILEEDRPAWREAFLRSRDGRELVRYSVRLLTPEPPGLVRLAGRTAPVVGPDGRVLYVAACAVDVSHGGGWPPEEPTPPPAVLPAAPAGVRRLSDLEKRLIAGLSATNWTTAEALARKLGESSTGDFRAVLRNLAESDVVYSCPGRGYRLRNVGATQAGPTEKPQRRDEAC